MFLVGLYLTLGSYIYKDPVKKRIDTENITSLHGKM